MTFKKYQKSKNISIAANIQNDEHYIKIKTCKYHDVNHYIEQVSHITIIHNKMYLEMNTMI